MSNERKKKRKAREWWIVFDGACGTQLFTQRHLAEKYGHYSEGNLPLVQVREVLRRKRK